MADSLLVSLHRFLTWVTIMAYFPASKMDGSQRSCKYPVWGMGSVDREAGMERLTQKDIKALLDFLRQNYSRLNLNDFQRQILLDLPNLVASDSTTYNELKPRKQLVVKALWETSPVEPQKMREFGKLMSENPLIVHHAKNPRCQCVLKISDFLSLDQFQRLALYNEFYRPLGVERQMAVTLPSLPSIVIGIALNRGSPDFSERDRLILSLLRPHLIQAYRNAQAVSQMQEELSLLRQATEKLDRGVILLTPDGRVRLATDRAVKLVAEYFGRRPLRANRLPENFQRWVRHQEAQLAAKDDVPPPRKPLVLGHEGTHLVVRHQCDPAQCLLLFEEQLTSIQPASLEPLSLSPREAEVLVWVAYGKTNAEIGKILGTSSQTVKKHLDHIYEKLGVENRTAAAAKAYETASIMSR